MANRMKEYRDARHIMWKYEDDTELMHLVRRCIERAKIEGLADAYLDFLDTALDWGYEDGQFTELLTAVYTVESFEVA